MINLNYRDSRPIYEQLRDGYRELLISGAIMPGERLPSVRELATQLAINPNTIQRAYRELEAEGYIYSVPGKGAFAANRNDVSEQRKAALLEKFDQTASELMYLGVKAGELYDRIKGVERK
ncbi:MAG: GntR family transcriptional regulator [Oscillospiraceae bacterium]|nr:GntR family transcriptional regulator [Oscillospiraceae bacterium]